MHIWSPTSCPILSHNDIYWSEVFKFTWCWGKMIFCWFINISGICPFLSVPAVIAVVLSFISSCLENFDGLLISLLVSIIPLPVFYATSSMIVQKCKLYSITFLFEIFQGLPNAYRIRFKILSLVIKFWLLLSSLPLSLAALPWWAPYIIQSFIQ